MTAGRLRFLLGAGAALTAALVVAASQAQTRSCQPPQAARGGWSTSFVAGCLDRNGKFAGGSQVMHVCRTRALSSRRVATGWMGAISCTAASTPNAG